MTKGQPGATKWQGMIGIKSGRLDEEFKPILREPKIIMGLFVQRGI